MSRPKRKRLKRPVRHVLRAACLAVISIVIYRFVIFSVPYVSDNLEQVSVVSAGVSFLNGGVALVSHEDELYAQNISYVSDSGVQMDIPITEYEAFEETPAQNSADIDTSDNEEALAVASVPRIENSGDLVYQTFSAPNNTQHVALSSGYVRNQGPISAEEIIALSQSNKDISLEKNGQPQILIYHTHATESFQPVERDWHDLAYNSRSTDNNENIVSVGAQMAAQLNAAGIVTIHDTDQHDNPSYTGAYDNSRVNIEYYLEKYPSIKMVFDVHRDAIQSDTTVTAPVTEINGQNAAQIMIISCADNGSNRIPYYRENLILATKLQIQLESDYPTLTRPILFDDRFYNQDLSEGALLLEMGAHGNTLEQVKYSAELLVNSLIKLVE